jgi:hypothetical protein
LPPKRSLKRKKKISYREGFRLDYLFVFSRSHLVAILDKGTLCSVLLLVMLYLPGDGKMIPI